MASWPPDPSPEQLAALHDALEPRRQELIRRLNQAQNATFALMRMREVVLELLKTDPILHALDRDFVHLFSSWFNRGFLTLEKIDWATPAATLEKIITHEAVHEIRGFDDLRRRIEPPDRHCFAFFHPALASEPLIFVEVALVEEVPENITGILATRRAILDPKQARVAVFYSISNCQKGLAGVSFGNFLTKQVVEELAREFPKLRRFVTLSPAPSFARWLMSERQAPDGLLGESLKQALSALDDPGWSEKHALSEQLEQPLLRAAAIYFLRAKTSGNRPLDPVSRFHLGNGARLERLNVLADLTPNGLRQSHGIMVNYLYDLKHIEHNHEAYAEQHAVVAAEFGARLAVGQTHPQGRRQASPRFRRLMCDPRPPLDL